MPDLRYEAFRLSMGSSSTSKAPTMQNLDKIPTSYATVSIGCKSSHTLPEKLSAIAAAGFQAIELGFPDLLAYATLHNQQNDNSVKEVQEDDYDTLTSVASLVKDLCDAKGLKILMLQPFSNFEGWPADSPERADAWARADGWFRIMTALGTDILQVGSSDTPAEKIGTDRQRFVCDLQQLADKAASKGLKIAYENWCWSTHAPDWSDVWDICQKVDRPNFGLCLDTFQSAGGEYADPTTASGIIEDGTRSAEQVMKDWKASCAKLATTIPAEKIYLLQISDAYKPKPGPLPNKEVDGLRPRGFWSHAYRPLPFEGYLPTVDFARAVLQTGFRGMFSYEVFDGGADGKGKEYDDMEAWAKAAMECQKRLVKECGEEL